MKLAIVLSFATALVAAGAIAQSNMNYGVAGMENVNPTTSAPPAIAAPNACPVALRADHLSDGEMLKVGFKHPSGLGQALHLTVSGSSRGTPTLATGLFRGSRPRILYSPVAPATNADSIRQQHIRFSAGRDNSAVADLWIPGLSSIASVELVSITFADGSTWTPTGNFTCSTAPALFMPVQ